ncbi:hypothetical protein [Pelagibacterium montanilacus]|uniref:hypothetical protein n=1 Tax=Pelagibacterium montanilacus TaxID=2185280 RepID=UPI000F8DA5C6|nr:hypothetical protein [Pelagibacterium montanilacus]
MVEQFFRDNPDRLHWVRPTLEHELDDLEVGRHLDTQVTIIVRQDTGTLRHTPLPIHGDIRNFPDDERFLAMLWGQLRLAMDSHKPGGPDIRFTAAIHEMLLRATGHVPHGKGQQ